MSGSYRYPPNPGGSGQQAYGAGGYPMSPPGYGPTQPVDLAMGSKPPKDVIVVDGRRLRLASWFGRMLSGLIDYGPALLLLQLLSSVGQEPSLVTDPVYGVVSHTSGDRLDGIFDWVAWIVFLTIVIANSGYLQGKTGQSLGKRVAGSQLVRVVKMPNDVAVLAIPGVKIGIKRALFHAIDAAPAGLGFLAPIKTFYRQTFADMVANTVVLSAKADWDLPYAPRGATAARL